jgi:predicted small metal-binding protein
MEVKMEYEIDCDDGFRVHSKSKDEVANMGAMHVMTMHPTMKVSGEDIMKKVKKM